jgi:hypothetical protein
MTHKVEIYEPGEVALAKDPKLSKELGKEKNTYPYSVLILARSKSYQYRIMWLVQGPRNGDKPKTIPERSWLTTNLKKDISMEKPSEMFDSLFNEGLQKLNLEKNQRTATFSNHEEEENESRPAGNQDVYQEE